jgi:hypothetical protein
MRVFHWSYVSDLVPGGDETAEMLAAIRGVSSERNRELNVTGTLIFTGRRFAEYLEGSQAALAVVRAAIEHDPRHTGLVTIAEGPAARRRLNQWDLSYAGDSSFVDQIVERALRDGAGSARARLVRLLVELASGDAD